MSESGARQAAVDAGALMRILEVTRQLARPFQLEAVLEQIIEAGRAVLDADRGSVFLYEQATNELVTAVATGVGTLRFPATKGIVGEAAQTRRVINVTDCYADPRFNREADQKSGYRTRCLLTVPLVGHDESLVGVLQLLNKRDGVFTTADENLAEALAAQCAVAIQRVQMTQQLVVKERLDRELAVAREIQIGFLPRKMPTLAGYDIAGLSEPAEETGGDIFDLMPLGPSRMVLLMGDATGHGVGPALSVTQVRSMLRLAGRFGVDLDSAVRHINDQLTQDLPSDRFVTAFVGILDATTHRVDFHAAGQGPIVHYRAAENRCEFLKSTAMPLGLFAGLVGKKGAFLELAPGDILGLITDGVFEYADTSDEQFGQERIQAFLREHHTGAMAEVANGLLGAVRRFGGTAPQADDITIVLIRRLAD